VKVMQRRATKGERARHGTFARSSAAAIALSIGCLGAPEALEGQSVRTSGPAPDTPRLLVAVFSSADNLTGFQASNAIRIRISNSFTPRQLYTTPWETIDGFLKSSGYKSDSALGPSDLKELGRAMRADEILMGSVTKTGAGLRIESRLARSTAIDQTQPLPVVEVSKPEDAARLIEKSYTEARKQITHVKNCENGIRDNQLPKAIAMARMGITAYPNATIARLCLAQAFYNGKQFDSALAVIDEIKRLDPKNSFVYKLAYLAYRDKGEDSASVVSLVALSKLDPSPSLSSDIIQALAKLGKPKMALPIVDEMLAASPGDPQLLRQKWLLTLAAAAAASDSTARNTLLAQAMTAGETMVRSDTAQADSMYFARQIAAAAASGNAQKQIEYASLATQKWPNRVDLWNLRGQAERRAGQLQMALQSFNRALAIDPKFPGLSLYVAQIYVEMNQPDSAIALARRMVAAGDSAKTWGQFLLTPISKLVSAAQENKDPVAKAEQFRRILPLAQEADKMAPIKESAFFIAAAAFNIASDLLDKIQPLVTEYQKEKTTARQKTALATRICPLVKEAGEMVLLVQTNMARGGSVQPAFAQQILGQWVPQVSPYLDQVDKAVCKAR
jgi:tetratricopeptide (TPR) repeat protein